jgi:chromosome segregation ATPase
MKVTQERITKRDTNSPPRINMRLLLQMAETLEDQAAGLYRRAASSEEEEFLLNREIEERQTEINRLELKLEAIRAERDRLMDQIGAISKEATEIREEIFNGEEEFALSAIQASVPGEIAPEGRNQTRAKGKSAASGAYFRRMAPADQSPDS